MPPAFAPTAAFTPALGMTAKGMPCVGAALLTPPAPHKQDAALGQLAGTGQGQLGPLLAWGSCQARGKDSWVLFSVPA